MKPRLIACDIDGTLLMEGQTALPQELSALIRRILDSGIVFATASGRQVVSLWNVFAEFGGEVCHIAENGAIAYVGGELVHRVSLDRVLGEEIAETMLARPECELYVGGIETCYVKPKNPAFVAHLKNNLLFDVTEVESMGEISEPFLKVSAYHEAHDPDGKYWMRRFGNRCNVVVSGTDWVDLTPLGVSKALGVMAICKHLGIDSKDCVAFGDADNDVEMFNLVGHPVAMEWASDAAKAHAVETTSSVADVLSRILDGCE
ncbi:MAG: HAD family hydrolase [Eggerthellaceae bacterium]|nr:HAD family hydrolase [Eggerthellaceae bacterium]